MQAPSKFCCQNKKCPDYGKRGAKNLTICGWFGKNNHIRLLYCRPRVFLRKTGAGVSKDFPNERSSSSPIEYETTDFTDCADFNHFISFREICVICG